MRESVDTQILAEKIPRIVLFKHGEDVDVVERMTVEYYGGPGYGWYKRSSRTAWGWFLTADVSSKLFFRSSKKDKLRLFYFIGAGKNLKSTVFIDYLTHLKNLDMDLMKEIASKTVGQVSKTEVKDALVEILKKTKFNKERAITPDDDKIITESYLFLTGSLDLGPEFYNSVLLETLNGINDDRNSVLFRRFVAGLIVISQIRKKTILKASTIRKLIESNNIDTEKLAKDLKLFVKRDTKYYEVIPDDSLGDLVQHFKKIRRSQVKKKIVEIFFSLIPDNDVTKAAMLASAI